jgi:glycosyltransferase involved in cell wall biosynthesis
VLPNPVPVPSETIPPPSDRADSLLYPVRALARKNLGEFLLLAHVFRDRYRFVSTLPPTNPAYRGRFERWKALAAELGLPARLGVAEHEDRPFAERMAECAGVVTTSLAEGFGLAFLEPWAYGREPVGRDLPEITGEFREAGLEWPRLYRTLPVPRDRLPGDPIRAWRRGLESSYEAFGRPTPEAAVARAEAGLEASATIDFALLGEDLQEEALRAIRRRGIPVEAPDWSSPADPETSAANRRRMRDRFSPEAYADRLLAVYQSLAGAPPGETEDIDSRRLLAAFLRPDRFRPHFAP